MSNKKRRYELREPLGVGGMGEVFRAVSQGAHGFRARVAVKRLRASDAFNLAARARLQHEATLCADLDHPNVLAVLDFDENSDGDVRMVMTYMDGVDLDALIESGPLPISVIEYIMGSVLSGLAYVHKRGIVHRDISLGNILISRAGVVRISDFGLAVRSVDGAPVAAPSGGTMGFASPEAIRQQPVDARTDLFSLGAVLYELLTGRPAFPGIDAHERKTHTLVRSPPAPHALYPDVPVALSDMAMRLLAPDPAHRYGSALEALDALPPSRYGSEDLAALLEERHRQGTLTLHRARHAPSDPVSSKNADSWSEMAKQPTERKDTVTFYGAAYQPDPGDSRSWDAVLSAGARPASGDARSDSAGVPSYAAGAVLDSATITRALVEADAIPRHVSRDVDVFGRASELLGDQREANADHDVSAASEASAANQATDGSEANDRGGEIDDRKASAADDTGAARDTSATRKPSQPPRRNGPRTWRGVYGIAAAALIFMAAIIGQRAMRIMQTEPVEQPGHARDRHAAPTPAEVAAPVSSWQPTPVTDTDGRTTRPALHADSDGNTTRDTSTRTRKNARARSTRHDARADRSDARTDNESPARRRTTPRAARRRSQRRPSDSAFDPQNDHFLPVPADDSSIHIIEPGQETNP